MTTVTKEMIGAAHDVMLAKGDFVLSAAMLERIYLAMSAAAKTHNAELRGASPLAGAASLSNDVLGNGG